jgi:hypothetical protein
MADGCFWLVWVVLLKNAFVVIVAAMIDMSDEIGTFFIAFLCLSLSLFDVIIVVLVVGMMIAVAVVAVEMSVEAAVGDRRVDNKVAKNVFLFTLACSI